MADAREQLLTDVLASFLTELGSRRSWDASSEIPSFSVRNRHAAVGGRFGSSLFRTQVPPLLRGDSKQPLASHPNCKPPTAL